MAYPRNTHRWQKGDLVIHAADAKQSHMLMRVIGYTKDGLCKTRYDQPGHKRTVWQNELQYLLNPADFGIELAESEASDG